MSSNMQSYSRKQDLIASEAGDVTYVLDMETGHCFSFAGTSARIWALMEDEGSLNGLVSALTAEYEVDPDTCRDDVQTFLASLQADQLVKVDVAP